MMFTETFHAFLSHSLYLSLSIAERDSRSVCKYTSAKWLGSNNPCVERTGNRVATLGYLQIHAMSCISFAVTYCALGGGNVRSQFTKIGKLAKEESRGKRGDMDGWEMRNASKRKAARDLNCISLTLLRWGSGSRIIFI